MTLAEAGEIFGYWERQPPTCQLALIIARMLGWKPEARAVAAPGDNVADLLAAAPPGIATGDIGMPAPVLDIEEFREKNRARMVEIARRNAAATTA